MKLCVIGGDGFIGRRVVRALAQRGCEVISADINASTSFADLGKRVRAIRLDVSAYEEVVAAFASYRPNVVINLAFMRENTPRAAMKLNILGVDNCFEAARIMDVERVVYSSSIAVNGSQAPYGKRPVKEDDPPCPGKQYAVHKVFNEWQAKEYREKHGMIITGVRAAHVAGTDKVIGSVDHIACIVKPALGERVVLDYRDRMRCIIHADDAAEVFARIALSPKPKHAIYNSGGETMSLGELAAKVKKVIPEANFVFENDTGGEQVSTAYMFDNTRLVEEFGMQYRPYEQRIPEMIAAVRKGVTLA